MTQEERRKYLLSYLIEEGGFGFAVPADEYGQRRLLRSLFNVRAPGTASDEFMYVQDEYLREEISSKGITDADDLVYDDGVAVWKGDITTLRADAIVNAANSALLGCFCPCHGCIDNAVHTYAGIRLRYECSRIMAAQGAEEKTGGAKITAAYDLPSKYVIHTVGPIVGGRLTERHRDELKSCYLSCLSLADEYSLKSVAFCCISTGEFHFPREEAAKIAVSTVAGYKARTGSKIKVVFNVFKEEDYAVYIGLLGKNKQDKDGNFVG